MSITVQQALDFARTHTKLRPLLGVGGLTNEPGLSIANDVLQELLSPPYAWKFNRVEMPVLITQPYKQDYLHAGATAYSLTKGGVGIDLTTNAGISRTGTTVTVKTLDYHPFVTGDSVLHTGIADNQFNATFTVTATPTALTYTYTHGTSGSATSGAPGITNVGWLESASRVEIASTARLQPTVPMNVKRMLDPSSDEGRPEKLALISQTAAGVLKFRVSPANCGTPVFGIYPIYQAKAVILTAITSPFTPIPNELSYVLRQGIVAHAYRYANEPAQIIEYQKFQGAISKAIGLTDAEDSDIHIAPSMSIMRG